MTISLENAKKLYKVAKEHGVELPESEFYYASDWLGLYQMMPKESSGNYYVKTENFTEWYPEEEFFKAFNTLYPAYTTDELLEWLPVFINSPDPTSKMTLQMLIFHQPADKQINKWRKIFCFRYKDIELGNENKNYQISASAPTPADALCKLAIKLIEEGVIK